MLGGEQQTKMGDKEKGSEERRQEKAKKEKRQTGHHIFGPVSGCRCRGAQPGQGHRREGKDSQAEVSAGFQPTGSSGELS